ncbi:hypothetical protein LIA77_11980 [Sarocladium implicatum]|nr:hypothetical protein LIA77_11980 [Sarocladium implicatum]
MVVPASHEKVWSSWSPPMVTDYRKGDPELMRRRDVLQAMIESLRDDVIAQVLQVSQPSAWHADSRTGSSLIDTLNAANNGEADNGIDVGVDDESDEEVDEEVGGVAL